MIESETQRQFYLGVAGIRMWYAREPLPGAAPSPEFQFPESDEPAPQHLPARVADRFAAEQVPLPPSDTGGQSAKRIASLHALMENEKTPEPDTPSANQGRPPGSGSDKAATDPDVVVSPSAGSRGDVTDAINLNLGIFSGKDHVLVAHISREASLRLQEALSGNILKSLGDHQSGPADQVHWPVFNNRLVPGNALADLKLVLTQVLRGLEGKRVIVLGDMTGLSDVGSCWLKEILQRAPDIEFGHSLAELASDPALKRVLWQKLKSMATA
ncbi:hypothetical protein GCM10011533_19140 [Streptosporangium jomthongense]|uniref:2-isopropylmalate synthase n=1 Tax=Marinobacter aromaticivorans TaxID=1494078 RepID=A0ABW2IUQ6_9GAMM|nr:2-isopropylmalate synthase [Marinobacter aromaticivorans]GGE67013.1 hypothetical protein GCM10011533_19140 [Streptosporangium jomthongense]